jgi:hypothetical protein
LREAAFMRAGFATIVVGLMVLASVPAKAQDFITVGELLHHCQTSSTQCGQDFGTTQVSMAFLWGGNCIPAKQVRQQTQMAVLRWLLKHPELANEDAADGIADAVSDLWPCRSQ